VRGLTDRYGGRQYKNFNNNLALSMDWLMARDDNMSMQLSRMDVMAMDKEFQDQDRVSYMESLAYEHKFTPDFVSGLSGSMSQETFPSATNRPDSASSSLSAFSSIKLTDFTVLSGNLGYFQGAAANQSMSYGNSDVSSTMGSLAMETKLNKRLSHMASIGRSASVGFSSSYDISDFAQYRLSYKNDDVSGSFFSRLQNVTPSREELGTYFDWVSGVDYQMPLTKVIALKMLVDYTVRQSSDFTMDVQNEEVPQLWSSDYSTWRARIGTGFNVTKKIYFDIYYEHIERLSDAAELAYSRDIGAAVFTFSHEF